MITVPQKIEMNSKLIRQIISPACPYWVTRTPTSASTPSSARSSATSSSPRHASVRSGRWMAYHLRSLPHLSTLQPHFPHVHPPNHVSRNEVALRTVGRGSAHRGQSAPNIPMPRLCDPFRTKYMEMKSAATLMSKTQVERSIEFSATRYCETLDYVLCWAA